MGEFLRVKNWTAYQHYNDRQPPWIKAHSKVLDDLEWRSLTDAQKGQLFSIWVLAARIHKDPKTDALVPADPRYLAALTGCQVTEKSLQTIIDKGFLVPCKRDDSGLLSDCYPSRDAHAHSASASVSVSVSEQGECEGVAIPAALVGEPFGSAWQEWLAYRREKNKPVTGRAAKMQLKKLAKVGPAVAAEAIEQAIANDWQGVFPEKIANSPKRKRRPSPEDSDLTPTDYSYLDG